MEITSDVDGHLEMNAVEFVEVSLTEFSLGLVM